MSNVNRAFVFGDTEPDGLGRRRFTLFWIGNRGPRAQEFRAVREHVLTPQDTECASEAEARKLIGDTRP